MSMLTHGQRPSDRIPTSSMADIAFLLLVFFLVTTVFPRDKGLALVLPSGDVAPVPESNILRLIVLPSGAVEVRTGASTRGVQVPSREIGGIWRRAVSENPRLIAGVQTSPDAAYGRMVDVLDQLQLAGARRVSLQLLESDGP